MKGTVFRISGERSQLGGQSEIALRSRDKESRPDDRPLCKWADDRVAVKRRCTQILSSLYGMSRTRDSAHR